MSFSSTDFLKWSIVALNVKLNFLDTPCNKFNNKLTIFITSGISYNFVIDSINRLQAYHSAKRDFGADQAWLYYAGALEMAALSAFMQGETTKKAVEYIEEAIITYLNSCKMPQFATRATLLSSQFLKGFVHCFDLLNLCCDRSLLNVLIRCRSSDVRRSCQTTYSNDKWRFGPSKCFASGASFLLFSLLFKTQDVTEVRFSHGFGRTSVLQSRAKKTCASMLQTSIPGESDLLVCFLLSLDFL